MNNILEDSSQVYGQVYIITNTITNKVYIGQAVSHRKNRNRYIPFGYLGRFKDHISEALCNTKKKQCTYLNNSIREYGKDAFKVDLLKICSKEELDIYEQDYIKQYNSLYPNGYNLTIGGKIFKDNKISYDINNIINTPGKRGGCKYRSVETRAKIKESLKNTFGQLEEKKRQMIRSQKQHSDNKLKKFTGINIDKNNIEQYIQIRNNKDGTKFIKIKVGNITTSFTGKYETLDTLKLRAINFLNSVNSATLPNCSGNP
jgi:hypothetical protein